MIPERVVHEWRRELSIVVSRDRALAAFKLARMRDVDHGGKYDARAAAIQFWSHPWTDRFSLRASQLMGVLYVRWHDPDELHATLWRLQIERAGCHDEVIGHVRALFGLEASVL